VAIEGQECPPPKGMPPPRQIPGTPMVVLAVFIMYMLRMTSGCLQLWEILEIYRNFAHSRVKIL